MLTAIFNFALPPERIALRPVEPRDACRLLVVGPDGALEHRQFRDLSGYLQKNDVLSFNDSGVIAARLFGARLPRNSLAGGARIEILLHRRLDACRYEAFARPAKRLKPGDRIVFVDGLEATLLAKEGPLATLCFNRDGTILDQAIACAGTMPLPPYIASKRAADEQDLVDYQTVYARDPGSVAAPTAGLHFTPEMLSALQSQGVALAPLTLHVGAGTFLPVTATDTRSHVMHTEQAVLGKESAAVLNQAHQGGGRVVAVGTTSLRTLESATDVYGEIHSFAGGTDIFITPGYRFRAVDMLVTNFHLPCSTLFMLVCAFMGTEVMQAAYAEAVRAEYRFYSYGDACLLMRPK